MMATSSHRMDVESDGGLSVLNTTDGGTSSGAGEDFVRCDDPPALGEGGGRMEVCV